MSLEASFRFCFIVILRNASQIGKRLDESVLRTKNSSYCPKQNHNIKTSLEISALGGLMPCHLPLRDCLRLFIFYHNILKLFFQLNQDWCRPNKLTIGYKISALPFVCISTWFYKCLLSKSATKWAYKLTIMYEIFKKL